MKQPSEPSRLRQFIAAEALDLRATLRHYLLRAGLGNRGQPLESAAGELLNEIVVEALAHEDRFKPTSSPRAWLLGIGANLIKRRQTELAKQQRREPLIRDLYPATEDAMSDDEIFDVVLNHGDLAAGQGGQHAETLLTLLNTLSVNDRRIVSLAMKHSFNGEALAQELGVNPGTARVRLHRALQRLRGAYETQEMTHDEA